MNIKELAEQANGEHSHPGGVDWHWDELERFADLVAAHTLMNIDPSKFIGGYQEGFEAGVAKEREECAKVCEDNADDGTEGVWDDCCLMLARKIRARSKA
jgi:hypothetical protein